MRYAVPSPEVDIASGSDAIGAKDFSPLFIGEDVSWSLNRKRPYCVTRVFDTSYAVTDLAEHFASGRAEDSSLFHKKFALHANFL
jgi:hypothetical protein